MWSIIKNKNWENIRSKFDWIRDMEGVEQDPIFHAEGDVAIHTEMVMNELLGLEAYQALNEQEQEILFAAVLLHDVEKRSTTVIEEDGRITSKGHAKKGEYSSRSILYRNHSPSFDIKEQVSKLVRYHGLPLWIFEKPNPVKALYQASLEVDTRLLTILATADILGRISNDTEEMLYRVDLFRAFCEEHNCYGSPKEFGSEAGRFQYFYKEEGVSPDYVPYEKDSFEVILMSALPGTGKDTFLKKNYKDTPIVSIDDLRRKHKIDPKDKKGNGQMIQLAKEQARIHLRKKETFIWNATNITRSMRSQMVDLFYTYGASTKIIYLEVPYEKLLKQNLNRDYPIPTKALEKMIQKLEVPALWEAERVEYWV